MKCIYPWLSLLSLLSILRCTAGLAAHVAKGFPKTTYVRFGVQWNEHKCFSWLFTVSTTAGVDWSILLRFTTGRTGRGFPESITFGHFVPKSEGNDVGLRGGKRDRQEVGRKPKSIIGLRILYQRLQDYIGTYMNNRPLVHDIMR